jgi:hypothetical protein
MSSTLLEQVCEPAPHVVLCRCACVSAEQEIVREEEEAGKGGGLRGAGRQGTERGI